jgi:2,3-bisphosphoglycerate-independent phosphoglycerate mutase
VANFANADMVGHTGSFAATKLGAEAIDAAIGQIIEAVLAAGGALLITADHGNGEEVQNLRTGVIDKEHSTNAVPFVIAGAPWKGQLAPSGAIPEDGDLSLIPPVGMLADVAPTVLGILELPVPPEMTGARLV